jgi:hypothetical protein
VREGCGENEKNSVLTEKFAVFFFSRMGSGGGGVNKGKRKQNENENRIKER